MKQRFLPSLSSVLVPLVGLLFIASGMPAGCGSPASDVQGDAAAVLPDAALKPEDAAADAQTDSPNPHPRPSLASLVANDAVWKPLANGGSCGLREGAVLPDPFPKRAWESCGQGCRVSEAAPPFDIPQFTAAQTAAGEYVGGDAYLLFRHGSKAGSITRIERLSDGATVAATLVRGAQPTCSLTWVGGAASSLFAFYDRITKKVLFGRAARTPGSPVKWHDSWLAGTPDVATQRFIFDDGYGVGTYGGLLHFPTPAATVETNLTPGSYLVHGVGGQLLWGYGGAAIHSYTTAGGVVDLIALSQPRVPLGARMSDDRIVWVDAIAAGDLFSDARWHWSPRTTVASGVVINDGPMVPLRAGLRDMQTFGDWAAADGLFGSADPSDIRVSVWNIATGQTFVLPHRPGNRFDRVFAVTPTELVVGERLTSTADPNQLVHLVRIELAALPQLVAEWSK